MSMEQHEHIPWTEMMTQGLSVVQNSYLERYRASRSGEHYCADVVWGNLQTQDYARAMLTLVAEDHGHPDTIEDAVAARTARTALLGQDGRTSHLILGEQALRTNIGGTAVMRGQLDSLTEKLDQAGLTIGIIPARTLMVCVPSTSFTILDGVSVDVETVSASLTITDAEEITAYQRRFQLLHSMAVYGQAARDLIAAERAILG
ncbi:Scr1 family TA system antitoxin-like transcriptional regulator [Streptomyces sp. NPDC102406]|uniref:Scr1 family TA system antitoxin-like transcriptional regulator n=1 Tax=Streptomyces sp. NPDC102406 TaxID=3366171 RepID=UPI0037F42F96